MTFFFHFSPQSTTLINTEEQNQPNLEEQIVLNYLNKQSNPFLILSAQDISKDLHIGINQAYDLFKQNDFPALNIGKKKAVSLAAYLLWKMSKKGGV